MLLTLCVGFPSNLYIYYSKQYKNLKYKISNAENKMYHRNSKYKLGNSICILNKENKRVAQISIKKPQTIIIMLNLKAHSTALMEF